MPRSYGNPRCLERDYRRAESESEPDTQHIEAEVARGWNMVGLICLITIIAGFAALSLYRWFG